MKDSNAELPSGNSWDMLMEATFEGAVARIQDDSFDHEFGTFQGTSIAVEGEGEITLDWIEASMGKQVPTPDLTALIGQSTVSVCEHEDHVVEFAVRCDLLRFSASREGKVGSVWTMSATYAWVAQK